MWAAFASSRSSGGDLAGGPPCGRGWAEAGGCLAARFDWNNGWLEVFFLRWAAAIAAAALLVVAAFGYVYVFGARARSR